MLVRVRTCCQSWKRLACLAFCWKATEILASAFVFSSRFSSLSPRSSLRVGGSGSKVEAPEVIARAVALTAMAPSVAAQMGRDAHARARTAAGAMNQSAAHMSSMLAAIKSLTSSTCAETIAALPPSLA